MVLRYLPQGETMEPIQLTEEAKPLSKKREQYTREFKQSVINEVRRRTQIDDTHSAWQHTMAVGKQMKVSGNTAYNWVVRHRGLGRGGGRRILGKGIIKHTNGVIRPARKYKATQNRYTDQFRQDAIEMYRKLHEGTGRSKGFVKWCARNKIPVGTVYGWAHRAGLVVQHGKGTSGIQQQIDAKLIDRAIKYVKETHAAYKAGLFPSVDAAFKHLIWRLEQ
jgi:hypothetical protein